jgi:hypothetical protein
MMDMSDIPDDVTVIREQITVRVNLSRQMVGSLYLGILSDQVEELCQRLRAIDQGERMKDVRR